VTPERQGPTAAGDGFVTYDELSGPDLDASLWSPARRPLPTGAHIPLDPNAELAVGDGELRVTSPRFSLSHDAFQAADSPKYQGHGTLIPERGQIGFGIWTMLPIRDGRSRSLDGQGMDARWRRFRVCGVDT
jgi:hypothetical protein